MERFTWDYGGLAQESPRKMGIQPKCSGDHGRTHPTSPKDQPIA